MLAPPEALTDVVGFLSFVGVDPAFEESFEDGSFDDGADDDSDVDDAPGVLDDPDASDPESDDEDESDDDDESDEGSATATQGNATTAVPIPSATASAPTLPMYFALPISVPVNAVVLRRLAAYGNWTKRDLLPIPISPWPMKHSTA
ncbi:hypothetical protein H7J93_02175 [Mycobacterium barrassiae]|uniref:hypothetical protein n=1 Tax=Mycobacterium barrassiae TaxID=319709 RepID=UPI002265A112|nr:hypothetical protein [Mycobacterium barrassiae]MCV7298441.1 hypothetical protein [Mycobacterium barrassiae]